MISDIGTVLSAELSRRLRSRPFLIGLFIGVFGILLITRLPVFFEHAFGGSNDVILMGDQSLVAKARPLLKTDYDIASTLPPQPVDAALLKAHKVAAVIALSQTASGLNVVVHTNDPGSFSQRQLRRVLSPLNLQLTLHRTPSEVRALSMPAVDVETVGSRFANSAEASTARSVTYILIFFLYVLTLINAQLVTTSVAEEKTSRIAELLVASIDPSALLAGKVVAGAVLSVLQLVVWIGASVLLGGSGGTAPASASSDSGDMSLAMSSLFSVLTPGILVAFFAFFIVGFFQLSTLLGGFASLINRTEDLGSINAPLIMPVVGALFLAIGALGAPDAPFAVITSMVPILSPFVMFARISVSVVPAWEIALSFAINLVALYGIAILAGKIYRVGMLLYGRAPKLTQIWHVLRT